MKKQYEEQAEKKRLKKKSIIAIVLIIFMIGVIAGISKIADSRTVGVQSTDTEKDESIVYKGETYVPKKNISTYLIAGIDSSDKIKKLKEYDGTGLSSKVCKFFDFLSAVKLDRRFCIIFVDSHITYYWKGKSSSSASVI